MDIRQYANSIHERSEQLADVVSACACLLKKSPNAAEARDYVFGRLSRNSVEKFGIGYFPSNDNLDELISLIGLDVLIKLNLVKDGVINNRSHLDKFRRGYFNYNNIIFPFKDEYGNIVSLAGRTLFDENQQIELDVPKYKNTIFGKSMHLYGLYHAKGAIEKNGYAIVVEGQIDCIGCHAHGFPNTVALTCSELTLYQLYLLKKFTNKIYLLLDNDAAGQKAVTKTQNKFSNFIDIGVLKLPDSYKDVDKYLHGSNNYDIFNKCI